MKKAAILLRGAVSKKSGPMTKDHDFQMGKAVYVNYHATQKSIQKHIIEANPDYEFDFFIHTWNYDLEDDLRILYNPIKIQVEDNKKYSEQFEEKLKFCNVDDRCFSQVSQLCAIKKVAELFDPYKKNYDKVIVYRLDVLLWKNMSLNLYPDETIVINKSPATGNFSGDFHFVMSPDLIDKFGSFYDNISETYKPIVHKIYGNMIGGYLKLPLCEDNIVAPKNQEVTRKLKNIFLKEIDEKTLSSFGMNFYEIYSYDPSFLS